MSSNVLSDLIAIDASTIIVSTKFLNCIKSRQVAIGVWNLLTTPRKSRSVRVVTIKHPPLAVEGITSDKSMLGTIYDLPAPLAIWMMAAGWVRGESRMGGRRQQDLSIAHNRRQATDRRSIIA
jgi:hypothetical protein